MFLNTISGLTFPFNLFHVLFCNEQPKPLAMAEEKYLVTYSDKRGNLSVMEGYEIPFLIKRLFYIYNVDDSIRGGHRHKITYQALICLKGGCTVNVNNHGVKAEYHLAHPEKCLILEPDDWHELRNFEPGSILLVCASEHYDEADYIFENYRQEVPS